MSMYWDQLTTKNFLEEIVGRVDTAILPVGSIEAHGQHCPLGTDNMAPAYFAAQLEKIYRDRILILPPVAYGYTPDLSVWPGSLSISASVLQQYVQEIGQGVVKWGINNLILLNGHGGNIGALQAAMDAIVQEPVRVVMINWWLDYSTQILTITRGQGHAGEDETSVMLKVAPEWVHMEHASFNPFRPRYRIKGPGISDKRLRNATTGDGRSATKEKGEKIVELIMKELGVLLERLWNDDLFERTDNG